MTMKNWKLTALEVQIISAGMMVQKLENELKRNLESWVRTITQKNLATWRRRYLDLVRQKTPKLDARLEREKLDRADELREKRYDREEYLNEMWLEEYDLYNDR